MTPDTAFLSSLGIAPARIQGRRVNAPPVAEAIRPIVDSQGEVDIAALARETVDLAKQNPGALRAAIYKQFGSRTQAVVALRLLELCDAFETLQRGAS